MKPVHLIKIRFVGVEVLCVERN